MNTLYQSVPVQDEAVNRAKHARRFMFFDAPGVGKTRMALRWWRHHLSHTSMSLVVSVPLSAFQTWESEVHRFDPELNIVRNPKTLGPNTVALLSHRRTLHVDIPYTVIVDEAHVAKNRHSKVHKLIASLTEGAVCAAILTGSPLINDVRDWAALWALLMGPMHFTANPQWWDASEDSCKDIVLQYTSRIQKHELDIRPPDIIHEYIRHDTRLTSGIHAACLPAVNERALYRKLLRSAHVFDMTKAVHFELLDIYKHNGRQDWVQYMNSRLRRCRDIVIGRHATDACIVFSHFIPLLDAAMRVCQSVGVSCTIVHSQMPVEERERRIQDFRMGRYRVALISIKSGGVSLNLQNATVVVFLDQAFCKEHMKQGLSRVHRFQQARPVRVYNIVCRYTLDEVLLGLQDRKEQIAMYILGVEGVQPAAETPSHGTRLLSLASALFEQRDALHAAWWIACLAGKFRRKRFHRLRTDLSRHHVSHTAMLDKDRRDVSRSVQVCIGADVHKLTR